MESDQPDFGRVLVNLLNRNPNLVVRFNEASVVPKYLGEIKTLLELRQ